MTGGGDEPDALYGPAARAVRIAPDGLTYRFLLRPGLTFHDGSPLTARDVAFSLNILKDKGHPIIQQLMRDVTGVEATDDATVVVRDSVLATTRERRASCRDDKIPPLDVAKFAQALSEGLHPGSIRGRRAGP